MKKYPHFTTCKDSVTLITFAPPDLKPQDWASQLEETLSFQEQDCLCGKDTDLAVFNIGDEIFSSCRLAKGSQYSSRGIQQMYGFRVKREAMTGRKEVKMLTQRGKANRNAMPTPSAVVRRHRINLDIDIRRVQPKPATE
jgi:hypothetical protein